MGSIAIIGQGYMGNAHANAWASAGLADSIKYVFTPHPKQGSVTAATNAKYVSDFDVLLSDADVKYVSVCTPTPTHHDIAIKLLAAGKHVLLEKPIALTISDAKAIAEASSKSSGSLMVAQVVRFFAGYQKLRIASESGELGRVLSVHARRFSPKPTWAAWLGDESQSGGMLVDFSSHDFDQLNMYLGSPIEVYATQSASTGPAEITVRYESGGIGHVQSYMNNSAGVPFTSTIDLLATDGMAHYEFSAVSATEESSENSGAGVNSLHIFSAKGNNFEQIASDDPYGRQIAYFYDQASAGKSYDLSLTPTAIAALRVSLAAKKSVNEGRLVLISDIK
jgi:predicted dehydrogenase